MDPVVGSSSSPLFAGIPWPRSIVRSGRHSLLIAIATFALSACLYKFSGGGLPAHVKTMAILPFDNQTPVAELQQELLDRMRRELLGRLGARQAAEAQANAVVRGTIVRYEPDIPVGIAADRTQSVAAQRKLTLIVDVEIFDQVTNRVLWQRRGLTAEGTYLERQEPDGRRQAIEKIVNDMIEGAQSQW
jgi:hypothetical protein